MEGIVIEGIVDSDLVALWTGDHNLPKSNDFVRGHSVQSPIPVWVTELVCGLNPSILIDRVSSGNLLCMRLYDLLIITNGTSVNEL